MLRQAARRAAPQLAAHVRGKQTTGVVGLRVEPEARTILQDLYAQTLAEIEAFPPTAGYASKPLTSAVAANGTTVGSSG